MMRYFESFFYRINLWRRLRDQETLIIELELEISDLAKRNLELGSKLYTTQGKLETARHPQEPIAPLCGPEGASTSEEMRKAIYAGLETLRKAIR